MTWIQIFKTGKHTASNGSVNSFGNDKIDLAIKNFTVPIPVIIGHSKPNYKLTEIIKLKNEKGILYGLLSEKNIDKFKTIVNSGMNRISAGFSNIETMILNHVALLGFTNPPALKDLEAIKFENYNELINIDLPILMEANVPETLTLETALATQTKTLSEMFKGLFKQEKKPNPENDVGFSENEIKKMIDNSVQLSNEKLSKEFETKLDEKDKMITELKNSLGNSFSESRIKEFTSFLDSKEMEKKITPDIRTKALRMFEALDAAKEFEFSEGDKKFKTNALKEFKEMLKNLPEQVEFDEFAVNGISAKNDDLTTQAKVIDLFNKENEVI